VHRRQRIDLVAEQLDTHGIRFVHREDLQRVAAHPERATSAREVVAHVLHLDQLVQQRGPVDLVADMQAEHRIDVLLRGTQAIDGRNGRHHDDVAPGQQGVRRRIAEPLDLLVEAGVLLDEGIGLRHVRLGLVVVVVADEVLHRILGKELPQLCRVLRSQRLVGLHHQHRTLQPLGEPGDGRGLPGAGRTEQDDIVLAGLEPAFELVYRGRLVAGRLKLGVHLERCQPTGDLFYRTHTLKARRRY